MTVFLRNPESELRLFHIGLLKKHFANRDTACNDAFPRNAVADEFLCQRGIGNKIQIKIALLDSRTASEVGCQKSGEDGQLVHLQNIGQNKCRKGMRTKHGIVLPLKNQLIYPLGCLCEIMIKNRVLLKELTMSLYIRIAFAEKLGRMSVRSDMTSRNDFGCSVRNESQSIFNDTFITVFKDSIAYGFCTGIVSRSCVTTED